MSIYRENVEEIHSFDARYKNVIFRNNNIVIPYINLGLAHHPLQLINHPMKFLDYSYMVFKDVFYLSVFIENRYIVLDFNSDYKKFYFGGDYWDNGKNIFNDMHISCSEAYLQTLDFTQISENMWMPFDTVNFQVNMDLSLVNEFFNHKFIPENIKILIS